MWQCYKRPAQYNTFYFFGIHIFFFIIVTYEHVFTRVHFQQDIFPTFGTYHFGNKKTQNSLSALVHQPDTCVANWYASLRRLVSAFLNAAPNQGWDIWDSSGGTSEILSIFIRWGSHGKKTKQNKKTPPTAFHLQKFKLGNCADRSAGFATECLPSICVTSVLIAFLHWQSAHKSAYLQSG